MIWRFLFLAPLLAIVWADQAAKRWCLANLSPDQPKPFLDHWLYLTLTFNTRGAFSLFPLPNQIFIGITLFLIFGLAIYALFSSLPVGLQILIGAILGGGIGNLLDRFHFGYVIDFLDLRFWPVFNIADSAISVSVTLLLFFVIARSRSDRSNLL